MQECPPISKKTKKKKFRIFLKRLKRTRLIAIDVSKDQKIIDVKKTIEKQTSIAPRNQVLILSYTILLDDTLRIGDYNIQEGYYINFFVVDDGSTSSLMSHIRSDLEKK